MAAENNLEVEVKFLIDKPAGIRQQILAAGAEIVRPRIYERNVRYDTAENALLQKLELLRLRQDTRVILTFKGPAEEDRSSEARIREEVEVEVSDFAQMEIILRRLGYEPQQVYEKYREAFSLGEVEIVLDELPFGTFVELEGNEQAIKQTAEILGLDWQERILANYLAMMDALARQHDLPFRDLSFENFRDVQFAVKEILPLLP
jgi:adenylate cyclase class 2